MRRILLTAAGFENKKIESIFLKMLGKDPQQAKALWIPTAAIHEEAKAVLPKCMEDLLNAGMKRENIRVYDLDRVLSYEELAEYDAVYVCGGDSAYLLGRMRKVQMPERFMRYVEKDGVYVGVSAGSCICSHNFEQGIPWLPCKLRVHCEKGTPAGRCDFAQEEVISLTNRQAVVFSGDNVEIVE